jgi:MIP family channel proteins
LFLDYRLHPYPAPKLPRINNLTMMDPKKLMRCAIAEFLGMALFVYIGTGSAISTGEQLASSAAPSSASVARVLPIAFAFGIGILVQAYSFGHISGGHFNPAVTFCLFLCGECEPVQMAAYIVAQLGGATLGSLLLWASVSDLHEDRALVGDPPFGLGANGLNPALSEGNGFLLEFMGTLILCSCVVMTAVDKKALSQGVPHMAPLAIGFAVFLAHVVLVPLTGCGINPARTFGKFLPLLHDLALFSSSHQITNLLHRTGHCQFLCGLQGLGRFLLDLLCGTFRGFGGGGRYPLSPQGI